VVGGIHSSLHASLWHLILFARDASRWEDDDRRIFLNIKRHSTSDAAIVRPTQRKIESNTTMMTPHPHQQWLVRFQNHTYVINVSNSSNKTEEILQAISHETKWPSTRLELQHQSQFPFISVNVISSIRGGKGGFGTLLKGQSKQAGAKRTTDFGACRDLQGRRLRHVNDEIKLRKWREMQRRKQQGLPAGEEEMWKTPSGLYNWHLMVPNWASDSLSKKGTRKMQRQMERELQRFQTEEEKAASLKRERERLYQQSVTDYVRQTAQAAEAIAVQDAIQQGLAASKKRKAVEEQVDEEERKNELVTLSGDFVVDETAVAGWQLQSKSEFGTMALVLDKAPDTDSTIYFEVQVVTGGLAQIGWADLTDFCPDTDSGDGVGDLGSSFAFDGSRCKKFSNGKEEDYGESWKEGDVIGCMYNIQTQVISFSVNGNELGDAFTTDMVRPLVPALSCNGGEILELHVHPDQMKFRPSECIPAFDLLTADAMIATISKEVDKETTAAAPESHATVAEKAEATEAKSPPKKKRPEPEPVEPINLEDYTSQEQLEELGMDRLKGALMAIGGVKCGGSLQERAARLWLLKGLKRADYPTKVRVKNYKV
jgi:hypothetical protein